MRKQLLFTAGELSRILFFGWLLLPIVYHAAIHRVLRVLELARKEILLSDEIRQNRVLPLWQQASDRIEELSGFPCMPLSYFGLALFLLLVCLLMQSFRPKDLFRENRRRRAAYLIASGTLYLFFFFIIWFQIHNRIIKQTLPIVYPVSQAILKGQDPATWTDDGPYDPAVHIEHLNGRYRGQGEFILLSALTVILLLTSAYLGQKPIDRSPEKEIS